MHYSSVFVMQTVVHVLVCCVDWLNHIAISQAHWIHTSLCHVNPFHSNIMSSLLSLCRLISPLLWVTSLSSFSSCYYGDALEMLCCYSTSRVQRRVHLSSLCQLVYSRGYITDRKESWIEPVNAIGLCSIANQIRSNPILLVTCTWLEDVNVSVVKCLCF